MKLRGGRETALVFLEIVADLPVGRDDLADALGRDLVLLVDRRRCDEPLDVPLVGIDEEAHQRHRIVGFVLDVGEDEDAGFFGGRKTSS